MKQQLAENKEKQRQAYEALVNKRNSMEQNTRLEYVIHKGKAGDVKNWKLLKKGMTHQEVEAVLDKPDRKDKMVEGSFTYELWIYPKGRISFYKKKAATWDAPAPRRVASR